MMPDFEQAAVPVPGWKGWTGPSPERREKKGSPNRADWHDTWGRKGISGRKVRPGEQQQPNKAESGT
ncbi:MAG: hypothetical protein WCI03_03670 [bacterium]